MSSKTNTLPNPLRNYLRRRTKRSLTDSRRRSHRRHCPALRSNNGSRRDTTPTSPCGSDVSAKLDALQTLIPPQSNAQPRQTDQLFKETADYIVLLKTRVVILQKLVEFFGSACTDSQNAVVS